MSTLQIEVSDFAKATDVFVHAAKRVVKKLYEKFCDDILNLALDIHNSWKAIPVRGPNAVEHFYSRLELRFLV